MKKNIDREMILVYGVIALIASVGLVFFILFMLGIDATACSLFSLLTIYCIVSAFIWALLLFRNC